EEIPPRQDLGAVGPEDVRRDGIAREGCSVYEQHLESLSRQEHGGRRARTPRADDDGVVHLSASSKLTLPEARGADIRRNTQNRGGFEIGYFCVRLRWGCAETPRRSRLPGQTRQACRRCCSHAGRQSFR